MILVTGAKGNVGSELTSQLVAAGERVRALVRKPADDLPADVEPAIGDLDQPESLEPALRDVRGVFLLGAARDTAALLEVLRRAGVERVVMLTSRSVVGGRPDNAVVEMWLRAELALEASDLAWTILRPSGFMSNALRWLPDLRGAGTIREPFPDAPIAAIDPYDIASVATLVLTTTGHERRHYSLSGPAALLPAEQVAILSRVLGRSLRFEGLAPDAARQALAKTLPPRFVEAMLRFFVEGEFDDSSISPAVRELTGRPPRDFELWAKAHAGAFL